MAEFFENTEKNIEDFVDKYGDRFSINTYLKDNDEYQLIYNNKHIKI